MDEPQPRLFWQLDDERRGARQTAYQIVVAASPKMKPVLWDTGRVASNQNTHVEYGGPPLRSRQRCYWRVRVWDQHNQPSPWSAPASWEMGLLRRSDWQARWIESSLPADHTQSGPCPFLRRSFTLEAPVSRARLYITALGLYEAWINGQRVGTDYFTPGWTDYRRRVQYQTYDVTALLQVGENVLGAILGDGWYCGYLVRRDHRNHYGDTPRLFAQLEIECANADRVLVVTDDSWKCATGPILASDIYNGEIYDARREWLGWCQPGFDDRDWLPVRIVRQSRIQLNASAAPRVRKIEQRKPVSLTEPRPGVYVFDMGQNMVGWARLEVTGPAGTTITMRFAEMLNPDGTIYTANLRSAQCTDRYTLKGNGTEVYEPRFTYHGFRYVEVTGFPGQPTLETITGIVVHSDLRPTGQFACSSSMLNQLQHNIWWSQRGNFFEVPTDCPQRDERLGWTGDAQVFCRTAAFNADVAGFFTKWLTDLTDAQTACGTFPRVAPDVLRGSGLNGPYGEDGGPAWADAGVICPWTMYSCYGDTRLLARMYPALKRYAAFLGNVDHKLRHGYGDWLNLDDPTPKDLISMAFTAHCFDLLARIAAVLDQPRDAAHYRRQFRKLKAQFNREFITPTGRLVGDSQTALVLALHFGLLPPRAHTRAAQRLVERIRERNNHLSTGFVGTPYLLFVLTAIGQLDLAYTLLLNEDFPSWGYPIRQGATTIWERWDGWRHDSGFQNPQMNSFNHYAYGAVGEWLYRCIAGLELDPSQPGYQHFLVHPRLGGGLRWARATFDSLHGRITIHWRLAKKHFRLSLQVPPNSTATVILPTTQPETVTESGCPLVQAEGVSNIRQEANTTRCQLTSGRYFFHIPARALTVEAIGPKGSKARAKNQTRKKG
ncbi:MAG: glycoside hydrolase family 78 protein [Verrucomicrobiae bacterium]|nr:glycoside hydrolase family 78 protein [Verrucomicrobiae bacterium]